MVSVTMVIVQQKVTAGGEKRLDDDAGWKDR